MTAQAERASTTSVITTAAVCVYHRFVATAVRELQGSGIPVAAVSTGFPAGLSPLETRLREIQASVADGAGEIDPRWVQGRSRIGVSAGASAPEVLVRGVIERLQHLGAASVRELDGKPEDMVFALPRELRVQLVD